MSKAFQIKGAPNYYVTDSSDVYSRDYRNTGRIKKLTPWISKDGYFYVGLRENGRWVKKRVHRLVAEAFIPNPENKPFINHKNGIRTDNRIENLEWVTNSENMLHGYRVLGNKGAWLGKKGKSNPSSKIVLQIKDGKVIAEFYGEKEAERATGIFQSNISRCCTKKSETAGGYVWRHKNAE